MAAIVSANVMPPGIVRSRNRPMTSPSLLLTSSPTITYSVAVGDLARLEAAGGAVVVGDGHDVEPDLAGPLEDVGHRHHAVLAVVRVDVEVGEQLALLATAARQRLPRRRRQ